MSSPPRGVLPAADRMASYRQRMRSAGMRPVQIWVPDTRSAAFADICDRQARAVATSDPAGDDLMSVIDHIRDRPPV